MLPSLGLCVVKFSNYSQISTVSIDEHDWYPFNATILHEHAKRVMRQLLIILRELHSRNLAHRFICPESIKWRWNSKGKPDIALCNLFLIERKNPGAKLPEGAQKAPFTGPYYAPEYYYADRMVSTNADIYSAGVIFAELLLNDLPDTMIVHCFGIIFPAATVRDNDPKWRSVDRKAVRLLKNIFGMPLLRKPVAKLLRSSYFR